MPFSVLGLQAAVTDGSEPTFDAQPMQDGTHLRWSFAPELGFPPGAFWLCRRPLRECRCGPNEPPVAVSKVIAGRRANGTETSTGVENETAMAGAGISDPQGLGSAVSFSSAGGASLGRCGRCCCCLALAELKKAVSKQGATRMAADVSNDPSAPAARYFPRCECGHALIELCQADDPNPESANRCECCRCSGSRQPPASISIMICCCSADREGGTGGTGGTAAGRACRRDRLAAGPGQWGPPDECGWRVWGEPFTLPVTRGELAGPVLRRARSRHPPGPGSRRPGRAGVRPAARLPRPPQRHEPAAEQQYFSQLRAECVRLVEDWPATPTTRSGSTPPTTAPRRRNCRCAWSRSYSCRRSARTWPACSACTSSTPRPIPRRSTSTASSGCGRSRSRRRCAARVARRPGRSPAGRRISTG